MVHSPNRRAGGNFLAAVSCVSANMCMATGHRLNSIGAIVTLAESWNGTRWSVLPTPSPGSNGNLLNGVSCASPDFCMAAGYFFSHHPTYRTLTEVGTAAG